MPSHSVTVDGVALPAKLGGHPALEFCNTLAGWDGHAVKEYLDSYERLATWAGFVGLLRAERLQALQARSRRHQREAEAVLERAHDFRARLYGVLRDGAGAAGLDSVSPDIEAAASGLRLAASDGSIRWEPGANADLAAPLDAVAWSAGQLLTSPDLPRVRACPGLGCGWLFIDRHGRRRWCTMAVCGNRDKVRRFAVRHREE